MVWARLSPISLGEYRKVEANLPGYFKNYSEKQMSETRAQMDLVDPDERKNYAWHLSVAFQKKLITEELYRFTLDLTLLNWDNGESSFAQRFSVALLIKETKLGSGLWNFLLIDDEEEAGLA